MNRAEYPAQGRVIHTKFDRPGSCDNVGYADRSMVDHLTTFRFNELKKELAFNKVGQVNSWLPLTDYSTKYKVSISTLRRRIKAEDIKYRFEDGKYFIVDEPVSAHQKTHRPSQESEPSLMGAHPAKNAQVAINKDEPILTAANKLLNELKKAYSLILQEKEEQILQLKSELADIKTLVRVLESENERLKNFKQ